MRKTQFIQILIILSIIAAWPPIARGALILQPIASSTDMGEFFPASQAINKNGLSIDYVTLVTDFDTYISSNPTADHGGGSNLWGASLGVRSGTFDLSLGGTYLVSSMAFWNLNGDGSSVQQFNLLADDNPSFSSPINLGSFTASNSIGSGSNTGVQVFTFAETSASYIRLEILNTWNASSAHTVFNEIAFEVSMIPEPSFAALLIGGAVALAMLRRKNK